MYVLFAKFYMTISTKMVPKPYIQALILVMLVMVTYHIEYQLRKYQTSKSHQT